MRIEGLDGLVASLEELQRALADLESYCQIWCTEGWSCDGPAVLGDLDTVVELDALDDLAELAEAA